jgi:hypothetical protein
MRSIVRRGGSGREIDDAEEDGRNQFIAICISMIMASEKASIFKRGARHFGRPPPDLKTPGIVSKIVSPFNISQFLERDHCMVVRTD